MAGSLNKAILIGNLGRDPEIRHTADGKEIASFSVATSETWKDRTNGEKKEKTEWHRVVVFNEGLVSVVKNYAKKGTRVYLEGILQTRKWVDNLGHEKYTTEIVLQNFNSQFILLDSKGVGIQTSDTVVPKNTVTNFDHSDLDDEIPF
ncbi:single-stranded DNA-binding protein [Rickettsia endosymbiont of Oedothorax gibbosus]|uniref:single-stranded DNA-binding protein n=1 Tax=Rickettsia endosymbiont of Oedothorax gibbosus TaxID=931099 RepID=UPI002025569C|nr:single-stranded DNA-binding protein [Rickettsia endosymbiont of Oedothorax gibbosus]